MHVKGRRRAPIVGAFLAEAGSAVTLPRERLPVGAKSNADGSLVRLRESLPSRLIVKISPSEKLEWAMMRPFGDQADPNAPGTS